MPCKPYFFNTWTGGTGLLITHIPSTRQNMLICIYNRDRCRPQCGICGGLVSRLPHMQLACCCSSTKHFLPNVRYVCLLPREYIYCCFWSSDIDGESRGTRGQARKARFYRLLQNIFCWKGAVKNSHDYRLSHLGSRQQCLRPDVAMWRAFTRTLLSLDSGGLTRAAVTANNETVATATI